MKRYKLTEYDFFKNGDFSSLKEKKYIYIYWFGHKPGQKEPTSNKVYSSKAVIIEENDHYRHYQVTFEKGTELRDKFNKDFMVVPFEEGSIRHRTFWLKDYDMAKAQQIVNDYLNAKIYRLQIELERSMA